MEKYKGAMARYYNKKVKVRRFNVGDLVLRKVSHATKDSSQRKLGPAISCLMFFRTLLEGS